MPSNTTPSCHTCRRHRIRCDSTRPTCHRCALRRVECPGYGPQPFLWVQPEQPHQRIDGNEGTDGQIKKRGRPKLVLMERLSHDTDRRMLVRSDLATGAESQLESQPGERASI